MFKMIERKNKRTGRIGVFAVAHATYWDQFEGLLDNIMGFQADFCTMVEKNDVEVVDFGMIDSSEKAFEAVPKMLAADVDVIFCNMVTYATSSVFAPIIKQVDKPMVLVALQPRKAMDYTKACTFMQLENDNICSVPEFTGVAIRMGKKVNDVVIGCLYDDAEAEKEIATWYWFAPQLIGFFSDSPQAIDFGTQHMRTICLFNCLLAFSHCIAGIMRGAGKATVPMFTMLGCWCLFRVSYISVAVRLVNELTTVSWAYPITWTLSSIVFLIYFLKADWIHNFDRLEASGKL